ncbi:hypothetical protein COV11_00580 [Candidatus Woesearchaeota archaeon CG10_big_fil_rev_8_21_14_0_10_30_7]|nr:MAG: hypothetical protein COV11_00580 [Candidatus Woesearchaeota archaeon CG10_big_fil_rev_8_21_14_0_10_30_7]
MVTLQFIPYREIENLTSLGRIRKLLNVAKQNKIVLLQGRLKREEEAELIKVTMEEINKEFKGIELAVINPSESNSGIQQFKNNVFSFLLGDRQGITIIGPANVVKSIKKDPDKIELLTSSDGSFRKKRGK